MGTKNYDTVLLRRHQCVGGILMFACTGVWKSVDCKAAKFQVSLQFSWSYIDLQTTESSPNGRNGTFRGMVANSELGYSW